MPTYISFQCNGIETLFLLELLNIPEAAYLRAELSDALNQAERLHERYTQILNKLAQDLVVDIQDQQITIEPQVHRLLMSLN